MDLDIFFNNNKLFNIKNYYIFKLIDFIDEIFKIQIKLNYFMKN